MIPSNCSLSGIPKGTLRLRTGGIQDQTLGGSTVNPSITTGSVYLSHSTQEIEH